MLGYLVTENNNLHFDDAMITLCKSEPHYSLMRQDN